MPTITKKQLEDYNKLCEDRTYGRILCSVVKCKSICRRWITDGASIAYKGCRKDGFFP